MPKGYIQSFDAETGEGSIDSRVMWKAPWRFVQKGLSLPDRGNIRVEFEEEIKGDINWARNVRVIDESTPD